MDRKIAALLPGKRIIDDGHMVLYRALPATDRISIGPFAFLDHYRHQSMRGIGDKPHPHAGIDGNATLRRGNRQQVRCAVVGGLMGICPRRPMKSRKFVEYRNGALSSAKLRTRMSLK
jgi:hypothetical protein